MNYYNEWDSFAAAWLKELIKDGLIPDGEVDSRSIADVEPSDLKGFTQCHFFAGIGGWSRALQLAGWSSDRPVWTGSPPCQSFSTAGKGKGKDDERHLWPVFFNLIRECQPPTVFGEQVAAAIRFGWLDDLQIDFEKEGYAAGAFVLPSGSIGAPHKRDRLFFVADSQSKRGHGELRSIHQQNAEQQTRKEQGQDRTCERVDGSSTDFVADSNNKRHERSSSDGRQAQRGSEHPGSCSLADTTSGRHKQSEQFSNGCPSQSDKRQSDSSGNCESQRKLMAYSLSERPEGFCGSGEKRITEHSQIRFRCSGRSDTTNTMGDTNIDRPKPRNETSETAGHGNTADSASIRAESVGDTQHDGSHEASVTRGIIKEKNKTKRNRHEVPEQLAGAGRSEISGDICFWQDSTVIYCRDGKYRPIPTEPALFPLADGIPNRVGLLRGAGNAIVPQAAAEIIKAYLYD